MRKSTLKSCCPFCGREMKVFKERFPAPGPTMGFPFYVGCPGDMCCPIEPRTAWCQSKEEAWDVWEKATAKHDKELPKVRAQCKEKSVTLKRIWEFLEENELAVCLALNTFLCKEETCGSEE